VVNVQFPTCVAVRCSDGIITDDKKNCICKTGFNGGGPFDDSTDEYPPCIEKAACSRNTTASCAGRTCGFGADGCGGFGACGICEYGKVCDYNTGTCSRKGMCKHTVLHQSNGLPVGGWKPNNNGETYTKFTHWAARPAFKCSDCGWGKETFMYWNPANNWPAELEVGWYISTELGSSDPLAYLPERVPLPTSQSSAWRFKSGPKGAWQQETTVTTRCADGIESLTHDYHGSAKILAEGSAWYGTKNCLLYGSQIKKCIDEL